MRQIRLGEPLVTLEYGDIKPPLHGAVALRFGVLHGPLLLALAGKRPVRIEQQFLLPRLA